jgi:osmotically-inducible protein OsmY
MADPRYRGERDRPFDEQRYRERGEPRGRDQGSDGGYIARRGFGNARSGYGPDERQGGDWGYPSEDRGRDRGRSDERGGAYRGRSGGGGGRGDEDDRGRDYGDAAGYGGGGSYRDFRDVTGRDWDDDRFRHPEDLFRSGGGDRDRGSSHGGGNDYLGGFYGADQGYGRRDERGRSGGGGRGDERGFLDRAGDEIASWFGDDEAARRREEDARREGGPGYGASGHHRGRGPRNYRRSDERIREDVSDRLMDDPHIDASDIEVGVANGEVVLTGTVDSRFAKRHAEDLAESVSGVTHVQNNIRVRQQGGSEALVSNSSGTVTESSDRLIGNAGGTVESTGRRGRSPRTAEEGTTPLGRAAEGTVTGRVGPTGTGRRGRGTVIE